MLKRKAKTAASNDPVKKSKDVQHEVFFDAAAHIQDEFWKNFFLDLSKSKLNRKFHIDAKYVSHSSKKCSFNYMYEGKEPSIIAVELRELISKNLCIYSEIDMVVQKEQLTQMASEFRDARTQDDWKKVKNKKMKDHLIVKFVLKLKEDMKWNWKQARSAYKLICNALYNFSTHKSADIVMENGMITSIADIELSRERIENKRLTEKTNEDDDTTVVAVKKINLDKEWLRVCNQNLKKYHQYMCIDTSTISKTTGTTKNTKKSAVVSTVATTQEEEVVEEQVEDADEIEQMEEEEMLLAEIAEAEAAEANLEENDIDELETIDEIEMQEDDEEES
jgi:hypothetical protein